MDNYEASNKKSAGFGKPASSEILFFVWAPQTGKTLLYLEALPDAHIIDLLDDELFLGLAQNAKKLEEWVPPQFL